MSQLQSLFSFSWSFSHRLNVYESTISYLQKENNNESRVDHHTCHTQHKHLCLVFQSKELQLDIIPASAPGSEVKLRDAAHELNEEKRKSARRKE